KERYLPNHPAVQTAQLKVDEQTAAYVLLLNRQWMTAAERMKDLEESYERQKLTATTTARDIRRKLADKLTEASDVKEQLAQNKKLTELLSPRLQEVSSLDRMPPMRVHLLSDLDPRGPVDRVRPNRNLFLLEGLLVGLVMGITLAFVDQKLRSIEEVTAASNLPILGVIPHMPRSQSNQTRGRKVLLDPLCA